MTQDKKLKQQIRKRAARTGESYATARRQTLAARARSEAKPLSAAAKTATKKSGSAGSVSDAKCVERTGHGLAHWFATLDAFDAAKKGHTAAARHLREDLGVSPWYSQGITVAYERERGLRAVNQTCAGGFEVSVSRVLASDLDTSVKALSQASQRARWLDGAGPATETLMANGLSGGKRRFRRRPDRAALSWRDDKGRYELELNAMDDGRSRVVMRCTKMPEHSLVEAQRGDWRQFLDALRNHLKA